MRQRVHKWWPPTSRRFTQADQVDAGLALLMGLAATVATLSGNYDDGPEWLVLVTGLLLTLPLALRRRHPVGVYALLLTMVALQAAVLGSNEGVGVFFALLVGNYTLAAHRPIRPALVGFLLVLPVMVFADWRAGLNPFEDLWFIMSLVGGFWLAGRVVWSRQRLVDQLSAQAVELEHRRAAEARAVAADERARIARDLHDVVAHSVSVMVVQAEAGEALLPDAERSGQALRAIQKAGRATLVELRHLLGVLDGDGDSAATDTDKRLVPMPSPRLRDAGRLVEQLRAGGLDVVLNVEGRPAGIPAGVDLAAYRVLQEALTNALRHAGLTTVTATVRVSPDEVVVEVVDQGRVAGSSRPLSATGTGHGLVGMQERVALYGGDVESGPVGSGFRVRARIPVQGAG